MDKDVVRSFWKSGYKVFGLHRFDGHQCLCGNPDCISPGKHPNVKRWQDTPHWDEDQLDTMINILGDFDTGGGILLGNDLLVVDCDERKGYTPIDKLDESGTLTVMSGSGGSSRHYYFKRPNLPYIPKNIDGFQGIDFLSGNMFAVLPTSQHVSGGIYKILSGSPETIVEAPEWLVKAITVTRADKPVQRHTASNMTDLYSAVMSIPNDSSVEYDTWIKIGMALHHATEGSEEGFDVWCMWSDQNEKATGKSRNMKWASFGRSSTVVTQATIFKIAEDAGWRRPVTFDDYEPQPVDDPGNLPFAIDDIDLKNPPGFVGEVTRWIDNQCKYPRNNLAVIAALQTVGDIVGLRVESADGMGTKTNLVSFCVAASSTGKEAVIQARNKILEVSGLSSANFGGIKSTQEIIRNLTRNQISLYTIDEVGYLFSKIESARKKGGSSYLDEIISTIMSITTKSNGYVSLNGDLKDQIKSDILKELATIQRMIDENECDEEDLSKVKVRLDEVNEGIKNPFLSLIGFSTPESFESVMTRENLMNGFLGRAIVVIEPEANPKPRKNFSKLPMSKTMEAVLRGLFSPGVYSQTHERRIEWTEEPDRIGMDDLAKEYISKLEDWQHLIAEEEKDRTGYIPVIRRVLEQIAKISLILGAQARKVTADDVRWATAFVLDNTRRKIMSATSTDTTLSNGNRIEARILSICDSEDWVTQGTVVNNCRSIAKKDEVTELLDLMVERGKLLYEESQHKVRKSLLVKKYKAVKL